MNHTMRVALAHALVKRILKKYPNQILGIALYGSVARNEDAEYSDVEVFVVTRRKLDKSEVRYLYKKVPVEISFIPARRMLADARQITSFWPIVASFYRHYLVLYERNGWFARLRRAVASPSVRDFENATKRQLMWLHELLGKVRNAYRARNDQLFMWLTALLGWESVIACGLINRVYYPNERTIFEAIMQLPLKPRQYAPLLERVFHTSSWSRHTVCRAAVKLVFELDRLARLQGISIHETRLRV